MGPFDLYAGEGLKIKTVLLLDTMTAQDILCDIYIIL
jgi:hypothetical protein